MPLLMTRCSRRCLGTTGLRTLRQVPKWLQELPRPRLGSGGAQGFVVLQAYFLLYGRRQAMAYTGCMAEPKFVPKPGQVDFTHIRYAPVLNVIVTHEDNVLMVQRSEDLKFYPGYWHCIAGFLDDDQSIEEKVAEELREELGWDANDFTVVKRGQARIDESERYSKTYLVVPVLVEAKSNAVKLDWEASDAKWFAPGEIKALKLLPGFLETLAQFFPEVL